MVKIACIPRKKQGASPVELLADTSLFTHNKLSMQPMLRGSLESLAEVVSKKTDDI